MEFILILKAVILGLVEALTEFAPVSSTGHMIIVDDMWLQSEVSLTKYVANTFKIVIQLGSILAVVVVFRERFMDLLGLKGKKIERSSSSLKLTQVLVGLIPAGVLGVLFEDYIDEHLFSIETVLIGLAVGAILMIAADLISSNKPKVESVDQMTYKQAFMVAFSNASPYGPASQDLVQPFQGAS
jgi:undecaprenyl-diphosphatase